MLRSCQATGARSQKIGKLNAIATNLSKARATTVKAIWPETKALEYVAAAASAAVDVIDRMMFQTLYRSDESVFFFGKWPTYLFLIQQLI